MELEPLNGEPVLFPPGYVAVRFDDEHREAYRRLYDAYRSSFGDLPVLRHDRDFDGRAVKMSRRQFDALKRALRAQTLPPAKRTGAIFELQERERARLFKRTQFLS